MACASSLSVTAGGAAAKFARSDGCHAELLTVKYRLPIPVVIPPSSVAIHAIVCVPSLSAVVSITR